MTIKNIIGLIFDNYLDELYGFYSFSQYFNHYPMPRTGNDKIPNEIICILKILGLPNMKTYHDLYDAIINPITRDKLSDDSFLQLLGISDDDLIRASKINDFGADYGFFNKQRFSKDLMKALSGKQADTNNHIITMIAGIDGTCMPGWLIKPVLLLDYSNKINYLNCKNSIISNNAYEWLITNMNTSMAMLEEGNWNANTIRTLYKNIIDDNDNYYYHHLSSMISLILLNAYDKNDTTLYANALLTALFVRIAFIELHQPEYVDNHIHNFNSLFNNYDNLMTIVLFICNQLAPNIDKPIEFITELVKVNIQDMLK